ncbi:hypothetical protein DL764_007130 [Monosporascus ibericus]|uniref:Uncharacterized protein n=1 Tax=Monosporascus ibericus TaxID=155417 RepID=A0A4Q4T2Y9_9PEZI|nr:hypothetical protein DL764_007130 [Monosporascus ibericus]
MSLQGSRMSTRDEDVAREELHQAVREFGSLSAQDPYFQDKRTIEKHIDVQRKSLKVDAIHHRLIASGSEPICQTCDLASPTTVAAIRDDLQWRMASYDAFASEFNQRLIDIGKFEAIYHDKMKTSRVPEASTSDIRPRARLIAPGKTPTNSSGNSLVSSRKSSYSNDVLQSQALEFDDDNASLQTQPASLDRAELGSSGDWDIVDSVEGLGAGRSVTDRSENVQASAGHSPQATNDARIDKEGVCDDTLSSSRPWGDRPSTPCTNMLISVPGRQPTTSDDERPQARDNDSWSDMNNGNRAGKWKVNLINKYDIDSGPTEVNNGPLKCEKATVQVSRYDPFCPHRLLPEVLNNDETLQAATPAIRTVLTSSPARNETHTIQVGGYNLGCLTAGIPESLACVGSTPAGSSPGLECPPQTEDCHSGETRVGNLRRVNEADGSSGFVGPYVTEDGHPVETIFDILRQVTETESTSEVASPLRTENSYRGEAIFDIHQQVIETDPRRTRRINVFHYGIQYGPDVSSQESQRQGFRRGLTFFHLLRDDCPLRVVLSAVRGGLIVTAAKASNMAHVEFLMADQARKYYDFAENNIKTLLGAQVEVRLDATPTYPTHQDVLQDVERGFTRCVVIKNFPPEAIADIFIINLKSMYQRPQDSLEDVWMEDQTLFLLFCSIDCARRVFKAFIVRPPTGATAADILIGADPCAGSIEPLGFKGAILARGPYKSILDQWVQGPSRENVGSVEKSADCAPKTADKLELPGRYGGPANLPSDSFDTSISKVVGRVQNKRMNGENGGGLGALTTSVGQPASVGKAGTDSSSDSNPYQHAVQASEARISDHEDESKPAQKILKLSIKDLEKALAGLRERSPEESMVDIKDVIETIKAKTPRVHYYLQY